MTRTAILFATILFSITACAKAYSETDVIRGEDGEDGLVGPRGPQGEPGATGQTGKPGVPGVPGVAETRSYELLQEDIVYEPGQQIVTDCGTGLLELPEYTRIQVSIAVSATVERRAVLEAGIGIIQGDGAQVFSPGMRTGLKAGRFGSASVAATWTAYATGADEIAPWVRFTRNVEDQPTEVRELQCMMTVSVFAERIETGPSQPVNP